jgi:antitoxin component of RelBE/YafQ-DinJ toxin-antitoxin module
MLRKKVQANGFISIRINNSIQESTVVEAKNLGLNPSVAAIAVQALTIRLCLGLR